MVLVLVIISTLAALAGARTRVMAMQAAVAHIAALHAAPREPPQPQYHDVASFASQQRYARARVLLDRTADEDRMWRQQILQRNATVPGRRLLKVQKNSVKAASKTPKRASKGFTSNPDPCIPPLERLFASVVQALLVQGLMPAGSIVDAGANDGREACFYARVDSKRIIHAVDPLQRNVDSIGIAKARYANIRPQLGGLGQVSKLMHVPRKKSKKAGQQISITNPEELGSRDSYGSHNILYYNASTKGNMFQPFQVERLDTHFSASGAWAGEVMGFGHFDTEGNELDVLIGGEQTIRRDSPVFTVELVVHKSEKMTNQLLNFIESLDYDLLLIEEECGVPLDCRNFVAVPRKRPTLLPSVLAALRDDVDHGRVVHVNASSIHRYAYPCCKTDGPCCNGGNWYKRGKTCCTPSKVGDEYRLPPPQRTVDDKASTE